MRKLWVIGLGLMVMGLRLDVRADEKVTMDTVVVTATKTEEQRKDVLNAVIVVDDADIQESPATSVGDLLGGKTGIDWRTRGNYGGAAQEIHIRGMGADGTQVLINGVTMNSPSLGTADVGGIPMNAIDRIEVVKGSGSVLYGSGAMGGLVNIFTKEPKRDRMDLKTNAGFGTQSTYRVSAEQGMYVLGDLGYYITAGRTETDGFRDNSDHTQNDGSLKIVLDKGDIVNVSLYGDYSDREFGLPGPRPRAGTSPLIVNGVAVSNEDALNLLNNGRDEDSHWVLKVKSNPLEWMGLSIQVDHASMENYNYNRSANDLSGSKSWVYNDILGFEGNIELSPLDGGTFLVGFQQKKYDWENKGVDLNTDGSEDSSSKTSYSADFSTTGLFGEAQYRPCKYAKAIIGVRHEEHSEFGTEVLPRYGLIVNPSDTTALKLNTGKHFRAPTANDLYYPYKEYDLSVYGLGITTYQGNTDLKPETGWHTDISLEQQLLSKKIFLSVSYFDWDINDKINWGYDVIGNIEAWEPKNLDHYEGTGWEVAAKIGPFSNTLFSLSYTYTDAEEKMDQGVSRQALYTADNSFKASLSHWYAFGLDVTATARFTDDRPARYSADSSSEPDTVLPSYWTFDLKLNQHLSDNWRVSCQVNNLLDEDYDTYAGYSGTGNYPGAGRSIFASATCQY